MPSGKCVAAEDGEGWSRFRHSHPTEVTVLLVGSPPPDLPVQRESEPSMPPEQPRESFSCCSGTRMNLNS